MRQIQPKPGLRKSMRGFWSGGGLLALAIATASPSAQAIVSQYPCDSIILSGVTIDHSRNVQVCVSQGRISYTYGKTGSGGGLDFVTSSSNATWSSYTGTVWGESLSPGNQATVNKVSFTVSGPQYVYNIQIGNDGRGQRIDNIKVYSPSGRQTAEIRLDPAMTISRVSNGLAQFGVKRTETDRYETR